MLECARGTRASFDPEGSSGEKDWSPKISAQTKQYTLHACKKRIPSSPEVEELSSGSGDDPGDRRLNFESDRPHSLPTFPVPPPLRLSSCCWRVPFSGDTERDSVLSEGPHVRPRRPSLASSPGNRLLKSVGIAGRFLGVRLRFYVLHFYAGNKESSPVSVLAKDSYRYISSQNEHASRYHVVRFELIKLIFFHRMRVIFLINILINYFARRNARQNKCIQVK